MLRLRDRFDSISSVSLPFYGDALEIGAELPDGIDLDTLKAELVLFYGDRLIVEEEAIVPAPVPVIEDKPEPLPPETPRPRTRKKR